MKQSNENQTLVESSEILTSIRVHLGQADKGIDEARELLRDLESIIKEQEGEIERLNETQIKPIANFLLRNGFAPGVDEEYAEAALRVLRELTGKY